MKGPELHVTNQEGDLGILLDGTMQTLALCAVAVKKTNPMLENHWKKN